MAEEKTVIERAKERYKRLSEDMQTAHDVGRMCMKFVAGEHWEPKEIKARELSGRPMITINGLAPYVNQIVNKNAMERARIKVSAYEDADTDKAKVINGLIRHIQYNEKSDAGEAYSHGFFCLGSAGFGYWRVDTEYCDEKSFDKDIIIRKIDDPFSVFLDPEGNYAIIIDMITKENFEAEYGDDKSTADWDITQDIKKPHNDDIVRVEYWERTEEVETIYKIEMMPAIVEEQSAMVDIDEAIVAQTNPAVSAVPPSVQIVTKDEMEALPEGTYTIIEERKTKIPTVKQYFFSGEDTLEENDWPGKYIPIIGCFAREHTLENDERFYKPIVYDGINPQKMYNFYKSQDAEIMQSAPKSTWLGAKGQFEGLEKQYDEANLTPVSRLEYNPVEINGQVAPPPQRVAPPMPSQGYYQNMAQAKEEIKDAIGIWAPSLGQPSNETSGKAILARRQQGDVSTYHYTTFFNTALWKTGIVIVDLIPGVFDTARTIRILGEDMEDEVVQINKAFVDKKDGKPKLYDLSVGKYDIKIDIGANSLTRRQDAAENLLEFARVVPTAGAVGADMIVSNLDAEKADELALRMKAALALQMPGLFEMVEQLQQGDNGGQSVLLIQLKQAKQQIAKLMQALQQQGMQMQGLQKQVQNNKMQEATIKAQGGIQEQKIQTAGDIEKELIRSRLNRSMPLGAVPGSNSMR